MGSNGYRLLPHQKGEGLGSQYLANTLGYHEICRLHKRPLA